LKKKNLMLLMLKIDLHVHTWYSDSTGSVKQVLEVAQRRGLDGIAITDHDTLQGAYEALQENNKLIIIPGMEIKTTQGEILAIGIRHPISKRLSMIDALRKIHEQKALAIVPHPTIPIFGALKEKDLKKLRIDGIEAISAITPLYCHYLRKNIELATQLKLPIIAGSDSHSPETVGDAFTKVYSESKDLGDILNAIKLGHTEISGRPSAFKFKLRTLQGLLLYPFRRLFER